MMTFNSKTSSINWTTVLPSVWMFAVVCLTMVSANPISPRAHAIGKRWSEECYATSPTISSLISLAAVTQHSVKHLMKKYETEVHKSSTTIGDIKRKNPFINNDLKWNATLAKGDYNMSKWFLRTSQRSITSFARLISSLETARVGESEVDSQHFNYAENFETIRDDTYKLLCILRRSAEEAGLPSNVELDSILNTELNVNGVQPRMSDRHDRDYITLRDLDLVLDWFLDADEIFRVFSEEVKRHTTKTPGRNMGQNSKKGKKVNARKMRAYNEIYRIINSTRNEETKEGSK